MDNHLSTYLTKLQEESDCFFVYPYHVLHLRDEWAGQTLEVNTYLANYLSSNHQTKRQVSLPLSRYFDLWEEWQEGIIDQDSKVIENRTLVIGQLYGTPWILSSWQANQKHLFLFANPFGDLFTPNSISPIDMLCTVFLFFLAILFSEKFKSEKFIDLEVLFCHFFKNPKPKFPISRSRQ